MSCGIPRRHWPRPLTVEPAGEGSKSNTAAGSTESKESSEPSPASERKPSESQTRTHEAVAANPFMAEALSLYLPPRQLKAQAAQAVASLQQRVQKCEAAVEEAVERYETLRRGVADIMEDEAMAESFEAAACCDAGATDARPMVRQLHETWRGLEEAKAAAKATQQQLTVRQRHLCTVASVLERLSVSVEGLMRVYPAALGALIASCRSALSLGEVQLGVSPRETVGSGSASSSPYSVHAPSSKLSFSSKLCRMIPGHSNFINAVRWHPMQSNLLASGYGDNIVRLWRAERGTRGATCQWRCALELNDNNGPVKCLDWHPGGRGLASGSGSGAVIVWRSSSDGDNSGGIQDDAVSLIKSATLTGHSSSITCVHWHPAPAVAAATAASSSSSSFPADILASGSADGTVKLWLASVRDGSGSSSGSGCWHCAATLRIPYRGHHHHHGGVRALHWHPTGNAMAAAVDDGSGTVVIWSRCDDGRSSSGFDDSSWQRSTVLGGHGQGKFVSSVRWHCSGDAIATGSGDGTVRIWRRRRGTQGFGSWECVAVLGNFCSPLGFDSLDWSPDGAAIVGAGNGNTVRVWTQAPDSSDFTRWEAAAVLKGHSGPVSGVHWHPQGHGIVSSSGDQTLRVWRSVSAPPDFPAPSPPSPFAPLRAMLDTAAKVLKPLDQSQQQDLNPGRSESPWLFRVFSVVSWLLSRSLFSNSGGNRTRANPSCKGRAAERCMTKALITTSTFVLCCELNFIRFD